MKRLKVVLSRVALMELMCTAKGIPPEDDHGIMMTNTGTAITAKQKMYLKIESMTVAARTSLGRHASLLSNLCLLLNINLRISPLDRMFPEALETSR